MGCRCGRVCGCVGVWVCGCGCGANENDDNNNDNNYNSKNREDITMKGPLGAREREMQLHCSGSIILMSCHSSVCVCGWWSRREHTVVSSVASSQVNIRK